MVNHPPHYKQGDIETIDIILDITKNIPGNQGYLVGNIIKYMSRYHFKNGEEDIQKARWYIDKLLDLIDEDISPPFTQEDIKRYIEEVSG